MTIENPFFEETVTPEAAPVAVDAFEAALNATTVAEPVGETVVADEEIGTPEALEAIDEEVALEAEDENDPNAEFRRALRTASGD